MSHRPRNESFSIILFFYYIMLLISLIEGIYIVYMFVFFKTCYSLEIGRWQGDPITNFFKNKFKLDVTKLFDHPTTKTKVPKSQICMFGKYASVLILVHLILRHFVSFLKHINLYVFIIIFLFCLLNYNALLYMIPVFLIELFSSFKTHNDYI